MKKILGCLLIVIMMFAQPISVYGATTSSSVEKPKITVKVVDNAYTKISWQKCKGAVKYEIYRRPISTNKNYYQKIATTKNLKYNDRKITNDFTTRYKVKAIDKNGKGIMSKASDLVCINSDWRIIPHSGLEVFAQPGGEVYFTVDVQGTSRDLVVTTKSDNVIASVERKSGNTYTVKAKCATAEYDRIHHYSIDLNLKGTYVGFKTVTLTTVPPTSAKKLGGVPLFSTFIDKKYATIYNDSLGYYVYGYDDICEALWHYYLEYGKGYEEPTVESAVSAYSSILTSSTYEFVLIDTSENDYGGYDYLYRNSSGRYVAISVEPFFEEQPIVAIVVK